MSKLHFLILATAYQAKLIESIEARGHTYELYDPANLYLFVSESENGHDRIYNGNPYLLKPERLKAKDFDVVVSRIGNSLNHGASILRHLSENLGIFSTQDADGLLTASDKLKTTQRLSYRGLRVPKTIYANNPLHVDFLLSKVDGLPAVAKLLQGSQGVGVNILETPLATNTMLQSFAKSKLDVKIQKFVDAGGKDIRAIVVGNTVSVAMERTANKGDFRANVSIGGSGKKIELSDDDKAICVRAATAVGLDFAGVDIMKDKDGKTYVIEVNGNPGTKIIDLTGHNYFDDLVKYTETKVKKGSSTGAQNTQTTTKTEGESEAKTGLFEKVKAVVWGSTLSAQEQAHLDKVAALKAKYPSLTQGL